MAYPTDHKTVFVLDHGPYFRQSCEHQIEFDMLKSRGPGYIPLAPISKSLWTCSVEAAIEYCRITWDIFPTAKLIRFIVSDSEAHSLNTWSVQQQNLSSLMSSLADVGIPPVGQPDEEYSVMHGLNAAIESLCECTDVQHEKRTSYTENASKMLNRGRVICITSLRDDSHVARLQECFQSALIQHNKLAAGSDHLMSVHHCDLVFLHIYPSSEQLTITEAPLRDMSAIVATEVHAVKTGSQLASKLCYLVLKHYNLASTTVTGIPMKEEQNASSSANYDVELLHPAASHASIIRGPATDSFQVMTQKEGTEYETVTLKWCTPRSSAVELQQCTAAYRITPVDVNSRPSSCLTNFLLNGRAVMLEMPRKQGGKMVSHMLAAHGGEIFIHTLQTNRSILEDPPSISEGSGGRVTDYRIPDFGELMKENRVVPSKGHSPLYSDLPFERSKSKLDRYTKCWPMTISSTTIFNMQNHLEPLPNLIVKPELMDQDLLDCKKVIYNLTGMESRNEALPTTNLGQRGKGPKREEQYRIMWNELESLLRAHCRTDKHNKILECLLECRNKPADDKGKSDKVSAKSEKVELDQALRELEKYNKMTEREKADYNKTGVTVIRAMTDSPMSPPPLKKQRPMFPSSGPKSLLAMWTNRINAEHARKHVEFSGRINPEGGIAKLYKNLDKEKEGNED